MNIPFGTKVRDVVSGFSGYVTARVEHWNGQAVLVKGQFNGKEMTEFWKEMTEFWIDEAFVEVLDEPPITITSIPPPIGPPSSVSR